MTNNFPSASEKCQQEKRKTVNGEDILFAMTSLGFENYSEALKIYLSRYREVSCKLFLSP
jgi:nuclear transcription Y subunit beta